MNQNVRIGLVGAGAISQLAHLPALAKLKGVQVAALCDADGVKARQIADRFGIPDVSTDIEDLLDSTTLDALVITTPNHLHEPHVLAALASKLHVMCERPLALTSRGVENILAAAARADRKVQVANNHRFRLDVQAASGFLRSGELGALAAVRAGHFLTARPTEGWRRRRVESGGGVAFQQGMPLLDLALWLADYPAPVRVTAHMHRADGAASVEDSLFAVLECQGGLTITIDVCWEYVGAEERSWFQVLATRGSAHLAPLSVVKELNGKHVDVTPRGAAARETAFIQSYHAEDAHFLAVIRGDVPYEAPTEQVTLHRILEAIYRSAEARTEIRL